MWTPEPIAQLAPAPRGSDLEKLCLFVRDLGVRGFPLTQRAVLRGMIGWDEQRFAEVFDDALERKLLAEFPSNEVADGDNSPYRAWTVDRRRAPAGSDLHRLCRIFQRYEWFHLGEWQERMRWQHCRMDHTVSLAESVGWCWRLPEHIVGRRAIVALRWPSPYREWLWTVGEIKQAHEGAAERAESWRRRKTRCAKTAEDFEAIGKILPITSGFWPRPTPASGSLLDLFCRAQAKLEGAPYEAIRPVRAPHLQEALGIDSEAFLEVAWWAKVLRFVESDANEHVDVTQAEHLKWAHGIPQKPYISHLVAHPASPYLTADDDEAHRHRVAFEVGLVPRPFR